MSIAKQNQGLAKRLAKDHGLLLVAVLLEEPDRTEVASEVRAQVDQLRTAFACPLLNGLQQAAAEPLSPVSSLHRDPLQVGASPPDIASRLESRLRRRVVEPRACITNRFTGDLGDQPDDIFGNRCPQLAPKRRNLGGELRNSETVRLTRGVLRGEIARGAREALRILSLR